MTKTIELIVLRGVWHTIRRDPEVIRLMGTDTIPTPFLAWMPAEEVQQRLQALNPDANIVLANIKQ